MQAGMAAIVGVGRAHLAAAVVLLPAVAPSCSVASPPASEGSSIGPPVVRPAPRRMYKSGRPVGPDFDTAQAVVAPGPYPPNTYTWMTFGPFDLSSATAAGASFELWIDTEEPFDEFSYGLSHNDVVYDVFSVSGSSGDAWLSCPGEHLDTMRFDEYLGDDSVYWGFFFESDSVESLEGAYIDDFRLWQEISDCTVVIKVDGFEGPWPGEWALGGGSSAVTWGLTDYRSCTGTGSAYCVGGPSAPIAGSPPMLDWDAGTPEGVAPPVAAPGTAFRFAVEYRDIDGDPADHVTLSIQELVGAPYQAGSWLPVTETGLREESGDPLVGQCFAADVPLPRGIYRYRFRASSQDQPASGTPRQWRRGPAIDGPPTLFWVGKPGYENDGVHPDVSGQPGWFWFRVCCVDAESDIPHYRKLIIQRRGLGGRFEPYCRKDIGEGWRSLTRGRIYTRSVWLPTGSYRYWFVFRDKDGKADGRPARATQGPNVGP